jgi:esterase/lipase
MGRKEGAFFVHGFLGYPTDFGTLPEKLNAAGIETKLIILPGHGIDENVKDASWADWLNYATSQYLTFKMKFDYVYLIGFSMGGTISTYLASKYGCDKLVLISPAFEYINAKQNFKDISKITTIIKKKNFNFREVLDDIEKDMDIKMSNKKASFKTLHDFYTITKYCKKNSYTVFMPVRIFQGENDEVVPVNSSFNAFRRFKSEDKKLKIIPLGRHVLLRGKFASNIEQEIVEFLCVKTVKEFSNSI